MLTTAIVSVAIMVIAIILSTVSFSHETAVRQSDEARALLSVSHPAEITPPDTNGFVLTILTEAEAVPYFTAEDSSSLSYDEQVRKRNFHLALESGAVIGTGIVPSVSDTAAADILSGMYSYSVYAADGMSLSKMLSANRLTDISHNEYIDSKDAWFDGEIMDALSVYGGKYLISSSITDPYANISALAYNRSLYDGDLAKAAINGELTLDKLMASLAPYEKAALTYGDEDIYPLYTSLGGSFATAKDSLEVTSLSSIKTSLEALRTLVGSESTSDGVGLFASGDALFSAMTLSEAASLAARGADIGLLPLPKMTAESEYRSHINIADTVLLAIPGGHPDTDKISYLVYRMAFLSTGYTAPALYSAFAKTEEDAAMLTLITDSAFCDMSDLFGYGDIEELVIDTFESGDERLAINYYNRKTLYEKAFEIIEKRLANTTEN